MKSIQTPPSYNIEARRLIVTGQVQGVGFRPFICRLAHELNLTGWVLNRTGTVEILIQGEPNPIDRFMERLIDNAPPLARPTLANWQTAEPNDLESFSILESIAETSSAIHIPPDYFLCDDCLAELQDPKQRRYRYPFINCTQCGPRYTLIKKLPYDRANTAMADFELCTDCRNEYENRLDRRFHAQPLACSVCGPSLTFNSPGEKPISDTETALTACVEALRAGAIVAAKGVGGYHLICDAGSEPVVQRLRERKQRARKPLAVILPWRGEDGLAAVMEYAEPDPAELTLLQDPLRPIVLVEKRNNSPLAESIAPGIAEIGIMLPYSPLHHLLSADFGGPLIATSANISGEPVMTDGDEVERRLSRVADAFLHHNRPILRPADDSVFRKIAGSMRPLRLGRGCAPLEMTLPFTLQEPVLAVGGHMKNTIALAWDDRAVISPHIGDLGSRRSQEVFEQTIDDLASLFGIDVKKVIRDAHPDYRSSRWAEQSGLPVTQVFHHHAHASALAGEYGLSETMLVFTWDGTGYGEDGTVWGSEALLGRPGQWRRVGSLKPFRIPGGDAAGREPWRSAVALFWECGREWQDCPFPTELLKKAWQHGLNAPLCSSAGRLFDAASALLGLVSKADYDGQAPIELETLSADSGPGPLLPLIQDENGIWRSDWTPLLAMLQNERLSKPERAGQFHASLAETIRVQAIQIRKTNRIDRVGLCGGVFQNKRLTELAIQHLKQEGFEVYIPERLPGNDAGISYGQIIEACSA